MKAFNKKEIPEEVMLNVAEGEEVRCLHFIPKKRGPCNRMFFQGKPSLEPQKFKCGGCGNFTTIQRLA
jgi:hypothetical protein